MLTALSWSFTDMLRVERTIRVTHTHSQLRLNGARICLLVSALILYKSVLFMACLVPCVLHFCAFCYLFHCLKWSQHCQRSQEQEACDVPHGEKHMCYI